MPIISLEAAEEFLARAREFERDLHRTMDKADKLREAAEATIGADPLAAAMFRNVQLLEDVDARATAAAEKLLERVREETPTQS